MKSRELYVVVFGFKSIDVNDVSRKSLFECSSIDVNEVKTCSCLCTCVKSIDEHGVKRHMLCWCCVVGSICLLIRIPNICSPMRNLIRRSIGIGVVSGWFVVGVLVISCVIVVPFVVSFGILVCLCVVVV